VCKYAGQQRRGGEARERGCSPCEKNYKLLLELVVGEKCC